MHASLPPALAPALRRLSTSSEMPRSVSNTPGPCSASAANSGTPRKLSASDSSLGAEDELARQVLLVVLNDERHRARIDALLGEVGVQVLKALDVLLELARLAVGDEHDAVGALEHELARRLVVDLPRHRVELELAS